MFRVPLGGTCIFETIKLKKPSKLFWIANKGQLIPVMVSVSIYSYHILINLFQSYGDIWAKLKRAFEIWSGLGMTTTGVRTCGDYMFSGHTVILTMLNFFITECKLNLTHYIAISTYTVYQAVVCIINCFACSEVSL